MTESQWSSLLPLPIGSHADYHAHLSLHLAAGASRADIEHFIHQCFASVHQADVQHFLPELLALHDSHGRLIAAAGMRPASQGPLFLERYLDEPLETAVSRIAGTPLERTCMVEVGNLASLSAGSARIMIIAVTWLLATRGFEWVTFTGAATLINSFKRLGLTPSVLAPADPDRLLGQMDQWGTYYEQHPQVFAGKIGYGFDALARSGVFQRLGFPLLAEETGHAA
ncbi:thermostable hemolysin [Pseudomonas sichuanensis]|uniref:thermostable hemolysin n=1 Tax=Pseudomonas sichuanensis TaxID=2213015 RepID=UPI002448578F|nr:thermostable hemolysin [Pseudomonas sichuanensis]MDH0731312.1 thermostable hemolysin [Pseudomonas sichuanensis]MDH1583503.1 thermostable hemolysin [Pseudomonas sichuanensis]MDH1592759.1 thermostable hemolysin [Pseudomonas sichuanensis]MDH1598654.1 thermostable hemolysin [Pseudomonas sichuanensis]